MRILAESERTYLEQIFVKLNFSADDAKFLADTLVDADLRGISSHGINRLAWYAQMVKDHTIIPTKQATVIKQRPGLVGTVPCQVDSLKK